MLTVARFTLGLMLVLSALFLILLVLIQRGRGGGLTGALGGAGGQSAFGTKAGDVFTRITVGVAAFWIGLCILSLNVLGRGSLFTGTGGNAGRPVAPQTSPAGVAPPAGVPAPPDGPPPGGESLVVPSPEPAGAATKVDEGAKPEEPAADAAAPSTPPAASPEPADRAE